MTLQPTFLLRDEATILRQTKSPDGHGGQKLGPFVEVATVAARFYMTSGGEPTIDAATGRILSVKRGVVWINAGELPAGVAIPHQGDRVRVAGGAVYAVLYSATQGIIGQVTLGEMIE